jgi:hypothetical protein
MVRIPLRVTDINDLIQFGLLKQHECKDQEALRSAVLGLLREALEARDWRS